MKKIKLVGIFFALVGVGLFAAGMVVVSMASAGMASLEAVYEAQNIQMEYDENGILPIEAPLRTATRFFRF